MEEKDLNVKVILLEQQVKQLEKEIENLRHSLEKHQSEEAEMFKEIKSSLNENFKDLNDKVSEMNKVITTGKATWKTLTIVGTVVLGLISILKFGVDIFKIKP